MAARSFHDGLSFLLTIAPLHLSAVVKGISSSGIVWEAQPSLPYTYSSVHSASIKEDHA
jgi:hypothetical protein